MTAVDGPGDETHTPQHSFPDEDRIPVRRVIDSSATPDGVTKPNIVFYENLAMTETVRSFVSLLLSLYLVNVPSYIISNRKGDP